MNLGFIKSPLDLRDIKTCNVQEPLTSADIPDSYFTDLSQVPVLYQNGQPSCVGHATASGLMAIGDTPSKDFSPRFIYALCKREDGIPNSAGTYYREAVKIATNYGCCDNLQFPNQVDLDSNIYKDASLISPEAYDIAQERIIKSYAGVADLSFHGIKQAVYQNKVLLMGIKLGSEFWTDIYGNNSWQEKDILPLRPPKVVESGHAILIYGYDANYIYFRNSFGSTWGRNGDGYFGVNYLPFVQEAWTFIDLPDQVIKDEISKLALLQKIVALYQKVIALVKLLKK